MTKPTEQAEKRRELVEELETLMGVLTPAFARIQAVQEAISDIDRTFAAKLDAMNDAVKFFMTATDPNTVTTRPRENLVIHKVYKPLPIINGAPTKKRISKLSLIEPHVIRLIEEAGRPLKTAELFEGVAGSGVDVGGLNPANNLSAHLSHSDRVHSTPDGWVITQPDLSSITATLDNVKGEAKH